MSIPVGIVGFRGYSGQEAVQILSRHPHCEPVLLEHRAETAESHLLRKPAIRSAPAHADSVAKMGLKAVLLGTPADVSMDLAPKFLAAGAIVVDLSGALRLETAERFRHWYKEEHTAPDLLAQAVYGLPEFYRDKIRGTRLVANPGCYPTAANLAIRPLTAAGVIDTAAGIVCDAKSGVSGSGRKAALKTSFCEVTENFSVYSILNHRHVPEVLMNSGLEERAFTFSAQLIPIDRGILETIYFRTARKLTAEDILAIYQAEYAAEPFVQLYQAGTVPDLHSVRHTNYCSIGVRCDAASGRAVVVSVIDNLGKGAAGQAIQNLNLTLGLCETSGLV
jgi:N-acetyl-gamma-glutamyl-phosphate reductase